MYLVHGLQTSQTVCNSVFYGFTAYLIHLRQLDCIYFIKNNQERLFNKCKENFLRYIITNKTPKQLLAANQP